jgi:hypothetical protein
MYEDASTEQTAIIIMTMKLIINGTPPNTLYGGCEKKIT